MSTKQSKAFKGLGRIPQATPHKAGELTAIMFSHTFTDAVTTTDVLELVPMPANMKLVGFDYATENLGVLNLKIGIMSGTTGNLTETRTLGSEIFAAGAAATPSEAPLLSILSVSPSDTVRSIGVTPSVDIAAGATKKLHVRMLFVAAQ